MSAFGIDTTTPTSDKLDAFFTKKDGLTVPNDKSGPAIMAQLMSRPFVPMGSDPSGKTLMGFAAAPGTANAPASSFQVIMEAVKRDPKAAVFVDKTIVVPDTLAKSILITSDPVQIRKAAAETAVFWLAGAKPSTGLLSASVFGVPVWLLAAAGGFGLLTLARKKRY